MSVLESPVAEKKARRDHIPTVPGKRWQANCFSAVVILSALSPVLLGVRQWSFLPRIGDLDWALAIDERSAATAAAAQDPKIVFIGGSNLRFGLDSDAMTRDLGVPVINYGLHAGLGMDVITFRALECVKPGDVVVFTPELQSFRRGASTEFSDEVRLDFQQKHPSPLDPAGHSFSIPQWSLARSRCNHVRHLMVDYRLMMFMQTRWQQWTGKTPSGGIVERIFGGQIARLAGAPRVSTSVAHETGPTHVNPYELSSLSADGSIISPRPDALPYREWHLSIDIPRPTDLDFVNSRGGVAFAMAKKICAERHCRLCVMPALRLAAPQLDQPAILRMEKMVIQFATDNGATAVLQAGETVLPPEDGFDSDYHYNDAGVKTMEPRLVAAMRTILKQ